MQLILLKVMKNNKLIMKSKTQVKAENKNKMSRKKNNSKRIEQDLIEVLELKDHIFQEDKSKE